MDNGSNTSIFTLIAILIFGIFISLSYFLFQDNLKGVLADVMNGTSVMTSTKLDNNGLIPTEFGYFDYEVLADDTLRITNYTGNIDGVYDVVIPTIIDGKQVKVIGGTAFNDKGLTSIVIPSTVTIIESGFSIPNGDGSVYAEGAFSRNPIKEIILPDSIISIGSHAFYHMSNLETVILPSNLLKIPPHCFEYDYNLKTIKFPNTLTSIGDWSFNGCGLTELNFPNNLTYIGSGAFHTNNFRSVTLPIGIKTVYGYTFNHCVNLTDVSIGSNVTRIENKAFTNTSIVTLNIPESVTYIDSGAFNVGVILN